MKRLMNTDLFYCRAIVLECSYGKDKCNERTVIIIRESNDKAIDLGRKDLEYLNE